MRKRTVNSKTFLNYLKKYGELTYTQHAIIKKVIDITETYNNKIHYFMNCRGLTFENEYEKKMLLIEPFESYGCINVDFYNDNNKLVMTCKYIDNDNTVIVDGKTNSSVKTKKTVLPLEFLDKSKAFIEKIATENFNRRIGQLIAYKDYIKKRDDEIIKLENRLAQLKAHQRQYP